MTETVKSDCPDIQYSVIFGPGDPGEAQAV